MKKKIRDLTDEEILNILGDDKCEYCPYEHADYLDGSSFNCPKEVGNYGNGAIYPPCFDYNEKEVNEVIIENFKDGRLDQETEVEE